LTVQAADGLLFPAPSGNDSFLATLEDASNNIEIVEVTNKSGDVFTIVRAQEGTTANVYIAGDTVELRVTAGVLSQYRQGVGDGVIDTGINLAVGAAHVHDIINCTAAVTITLAITVKNESTADVTIDRATGSDTIDGAIQNITLGARDSIYLSVNATEDGYVSMFSGASAAYPIGSVYMSTVATDPNILLGFGTWASIDGRFLVGVGDNGDGKAYTAAEEGGSKDAVVVVHDHNYTDPGHTHLIKDAISGGSAERADRGSNENTGTFLSNSSTTGITILNEGVAGTDLNLPPYYGVYMWRRTA
jgi:hypothetical protein